MEFSWRPVATGGIVPRGRLARASRVMFACHYFTLVRWFRAGRRLRVLFLDARQQVESTTDCLSGWSSTMDFDKEVDARGLNCPLPILRAKKALAEMQPGQVLHVLATDPGSSKDFAAFARQTGNELVSQADLPDKAFEFFLRRK